MKKIQLGKTLLTETSEPFVIAEIGVNHEGSLETAFRLIELAKEGGANVAKFQSYKASTLASKFSPSYWDLSKEPTTSQFELFKKYDAFGEKEYQALYGHCQKVGIEFLSAPFDDAAVEFLDPLLSYFKIASADATNIPLLKRVASKGKPVLLSVGASYLHEVKFAVELLKKSGCPEVALLHCVLNYPTPDENANLDMILSLRKYFPEIIIGYSDHTLPDSSMVNLTTAYLKGAVIIEKHFTNNKLLPGNDHYHAMDVEDLKNFRKQIRKVRLTEGRKFKTLLSAEELARKNARRSIVLTEDIKKGTVLEEKHLTYKRPGLGVSPLCWDRVLGRHVNADLPEDHVLQWENLEKEIKREWVVAIIQARMGSTRFPGKMMANLANTPILDWVIKRIKKAKRIDEVILATSMDPSNDALEARAFELGIRTFRGDEEDVLSRFQLAAVESGADIIVRVCADNPFIDPEEVDRLIEVFKEKRPDYAFNHIPKMSNQYPDGFGAEALSIDTLNRLFKKARDKNYREHVTSYIWEHIEKFNVITLQAPAHISKPELRFDIDTPEDLVRLEPYAVKGQLDGRAEDFMS